MASKPRLSLALILSSKRARAVGLLVLLSSLLLWGLRYAPSLDLVGVRKLGHGISAAVPMPATTPAPAPAPAPSPPPAPTPAPAVVHGDVDWSRYAYCQYVTDENYLCNSVMIFETLSRLGAKADLIMMYPDHWDVGGTATTHAISLLRQARDKYGVKLIPINVVKRYTGGLGSSTWAESYTKLLAFNQTQYDRLLSLDSDSTILQHMDELFLLPKVLVAMPRAYWLDPKDRVLSSQIALIQPSTSEFQRILRAIDGAKEGEYDMEIMNNLYRDSALILPHRPYNLLTGEFRSGNHSKYLGNPEEQWDSDKVLEEAKFLHFSDWPRPKPWLAAPSKTVDEIQPKCDSNKTTQAQGCRERELWLGFYSDFTARRKEICGLETVSYLGVLGRRRLSGDALYGSPLRYPA